MKFNSCRAFILLVVLLWNHAAISNTVNLVAAENFYGEVAKEIAEPFVKVISIIDSPTQDPHFFSTSPRILKNIIDADIVVYNGLNYDPWMERLLSTTKKKKTIIEIAQLLGKTPGNNPHLWYDPRTMPIYAKTLMKLLTQRDAQHKNYYAERYEIFIKKYQLLLSVIKNMKNQYHTIKIAATEPLFNYMAEAIDLTMLGNDFQLSIMNEIPPSPSQVRNFENNLISKNVRALIYNKQVINPITQRMLTIAKQQHIPVVGVSEMQPLGKTYIEWMIMQLTELNNALRN